MAANASADDSQVPNEGKTRDVKLTPVSVCRMQESVTIEPGSMAHTGLGVFDEVDRPVYSQCLDSVNAQLKEHAQRLQILERSFIEFKENFHATLKNDGKVNIISLDDIVPDLGDNVTSNTTLPDTEEQAEQTKPSSAGSVGTRLPDWCQGVKVLDFSVPDMSVPDANFCSISWSGLKGDMKTEVHIVGATLWEIMIVACINPLSRLSSLMLIFAFWANILLQGLVIGVIDIEFTGSTEMDVDSLEVWRYTQAHAKGNVNELTQESLASRVCRQDSSLGAFSGMAEMVSDIDAYLKPLLFLGYSGQVLCTVAIIVWAFQSMRDILNSFSFLHAVSRVPTGAASELKWQADDGSLQFVTISSRRKVLLYLITLVRIIFCCWLLILGCSWIANTYHVEDLVLNALALAFVLDLDELCFEVMAPMSVHAVQEVLQPLSTHVGLSLAIPANCVSTFITLYYLFMHIRPLARNLQAARDTICDGQLHFATHLNEDSKLLYMSTTRESEPDNVWPAGGMPEEAAVVESLVKSENVVSHSGVVFMKDLAAMSLRSEVQISVLVQDKFTCSDKMESMPPFVLATLQRYNANPNAKTCEGLKGGCFDLDQKFLRLNCPVTCGADSPRSGQLLNTARYGVDQEKCHQKETYRSAFAAIQCVDPSPSQLRALPGWNRTWNLAVTLWGRFSASMKNCFQEVADTFILKGCSAISHMQGTSPCDLWDMRDLCSGKEELPNLAVFCPVACGCTMSNSTACPTLCNEHKEIRPLNGSQDGGPDQLR